MKITFEKSKCFHLKINSLTSPNDQGNYLSPQDLLNVEGFVKEFIFKGIIPTMERAILTLNEYVSIAF
jgi:hypothetical protein